MKYSIYQWVYGQILDVSFFMILRYQQYNIERKHKVLLSSQYKLYYSN